MPTSILAALFAVTAAIALLVGFRVERTRSREGKMLAFVALLVLPVVVAWTGFSEQMDRATSTKFCLSCHVMQDYGKSLYVDDPSYIPARHFQNNRIPRDHACYTCHTEYTMFGGVKAKARGLRHLWVQYAVGAPKPEAVKLYEPFPNGECLHCHLGARRFEEGSAHNKIPNLLEQVKAGQKSCVSSGCHEFIHDVASLKDAPLWKERR
jgi:cytochrome c-type protein NapC